MKKQHSIHKVASLFDEIYIAHCSNETGEVIKHEYGDGVEITPPKSQAVRYYAVYKTNGYQNKEIDKRQSSQEAQAIANYYNRKQDGYAYSVGPVYFNDNEFKQGEIW